MNSINIKFVGKNIKSGEVLLSSIFTIDDIMSGNIDSFWQISNRDKTHIFIGKLLGSGCLDKNNIEIFEGDILKFQGGSLYDRNIKFGCVIRDKGELKILYRDELEIQRNQSGIFYHIGMVMESKEIVGNAFQNKELVYKYLSESGDFKI